MAAQLPVQNPLAVQAGVIPANIPNIPLAGAQAVPVPEAANHMVQQNKGEQKLPPQLLLDFGGTRSDYTRVNCRMSIDNQETMARLVWAQLSCLENRDISITEAVFVKLWKTFILKRSQDVYEKCKNTRPANFVRFYPDFPIPKPLYDLLASIGQCYDNTNGITYDIVPEPLSAGNQQAWYTLTVAEFHLFIAEMKRYERVYEMCEFPLKTDYEGRAIQRCGLDDVGNLRQVKARTSIIRPSDALITMMHDQLWHAPHQIGDCHVVCTDQLDRAGICSLYVSSFVKRNATN